MAEPEGPQVAELGPFTTYLAEQVSDIEEIRKAMENRYRIFIKPLDEADEDGGRRGQGFPPQDPDVIRMRELLDGGKRLAMVEMVSGDKRRAVVPVPGIITYEQIAVKQLEDNMKNSPWWPWLQTAPGVGAKTLARLLAAIRDPRWHYEGDRRRTLAELRSYCGMDVTDDGTAPRRMRGVKVNWNPEARIRLWVIGGTCLKYTGTSRYKDTYYAAREHHEAAVHKGPCPRCGPKGNPATTGSPLSKGHIHARATRAMTKHVLRDLWLEARRLRGEQVTVEPPEPGLRPAA